MKFENTFAVEAPIEQVWGTLLDIDKVAPCMPGAEVLEQTGEGAYKVAVKVKLGPMSMQYTGDLQVLEADPVAHQAVMHAKAKEAKGQGTANAEIQMNLAENGAITEGAIATDIRLSGKAAAMGAGVIQDVSARLVDTFATNLATMLAAEPAPAGASAPGPAAAPEAAAPPESIATPAAAVTEAPAPTRKPIRFAPKIAQPRAAGEPASDDSGLDVGSLVITVIKGRLRAILDRAS